MFRFDFTAMILLVIAISLPLESASAAEGYWILDQVSRDYGGRDDVSTVWEETSETSIAGRSSWQWASMDCSQTVATTFSWSEMPLSMKTGEQYNLTIREEQTENNNCMSVSSNMMIYAGYPVSDSDIKNMESVVDGPQVHLGSADSRALEQTSPIYGPYPYGPNDLDRDYAILVECYLYQDWYRIQYRYKWVEGNDIAGQG